MSSVPTSPSRRAARRRFAVTAVLGAAAGLAVVLATASAASAAPPSNDSFANAQVLSGPSPSARGTNVGASREAGEPNHAGYTSGKSIWYRWTAPVISPYTKARVSLLGSDFDSTAAVYTGSSVNALTLVNYADDFQGSLQTVVDFTPVMGTTYYIAVDGATNAGVTPTGHVEIAISDLGLTGQVSGTVTGPGGGGVGGVCVWAVDSGGADVRGWARTASDGGYVLYGVPAGTTNHIVFRNCSSASVPGESVANVADEFYNDAQTAAGAANVTVLAGLETTGINAQLATGGTITGTVTTTANAAPDVCVVARKTSGGDLGAVRSAVTGEDGTYAITGLDGGSYQVEFGSVDADLCAAGTNGFVQEFYDDPGVSGTNNPVAVVEGATTSGINADLAVSGNISGTVTALAGGAQLGDICVRANNGSYTSPVVNTSASGTYTITNLPPAADYVVRFADCHATSNPYDTLWWNNTLSQAAATPVTVAPGETTTGINAQMFHAGHIDGTIVDPNGNARENACARLYTAADVQVDDTSVGDGGYWEFNALKPGDYKVQAYRCAAGLQFTPEFWNDQPTIGAATLITVGDGQSVTGIDMALAGTGNGRVIGTITGQGGAPLAGICVSAGSYTTTTAADGTYALLDLPPTTYEVDFNECVIGSRNLLPVSVPGTVVVTGTTTVVSRTMPTGGTITGHVTDTHGNPAEGVCVEPLSTPQEVFTDSNGNYTVQSLPTDSYVMYFEECDQVYQPIYYAGVTDYNDATPVNVVAGQVTSGINVAMIRNGSVSGLVTNEAGDPLANICVAVFPAADPNNSVWISLTDADGTYRAGNITSSGSYKVKFYDCNTGPTYGEEFYDNKITFDDGTAVPVTFGADSPGIDAVLQTTAPVNTTWPMITGQMYVGQTLTATPGIWQHEPGQFTYAWYRCLPDPTFHCDPANVSTPTYNLTQSDVGSYMEVRVTATNSKGSATQSSGTGPNAVQDKPAVTTAPAVSGVAAVGSTLTTTSGSWTGSPTFAYKWQRCNASVSTCTTITGATATTYQVATDDNGFRLRSHVTATNPAGFTTTWSAVTAVVGAPTLVSAPSVSGTTGVGDTLTTTSGTWTGSPTFAYHWQRCNAAVTSCATIGGATASTYQIVSDDIGFRLRSHVTASNAVDSATAWSTVTAVIGVPTNTAAPQVTGSTGVGDTLTTTSGTWTNSPTSYAYQWQRCNTAVTTCTAIGGATASTYQITSGDIGFRLRSHVTATNAAGNGTAWSAASVIVGQPSVLTAPDVSGQTAVGGTLTVTNGSWAGSPTSYAYRWQRCNTAVTTCTTIGGATASTYQITSDDIGFRIRGHVTATNAAGSSTSWSDITVVVGQPGLLAAPAVTGTATVGNVLNVSTGTWDGSPTSFAYQWQRCNAAVTTCTAIPGATASSYTVSAGDVGFRIRGHVTATNAAGSKTSWSTITAVVG